MELRRAVPEDEEFFRSFDRHITPAQYHSLVQAQTAYLLWEAGGRIGVMWHCVLWGNLPFLNLLILREDARGRGFGREAMRLWESELKAQGYPMALVSTQADEEAQHFYRRLGYVDCGGLVLLDQPMELFLQKLL